jgi:hypothetical protein
MIFRRIRIAILLSVLVIVGLGTWWQSRANENWGQAFRLTIYPINGDGSPQVNEFIANLTESDFIAVNSFLQAQAREYNLPVQPLFYLSLGPQLKEAPPIPPADRTPLNMVTWSLGLRYWLFRSTRSVGLDSRHIRMFVVYHQGEKDMRLAHSYGLQKGLLGVVNAFAIPAEAGSNRVVIAHELLHLFGATDKYDDGNLPVYPDGYAQPDRYPLYPQTLAEIMGGRIPVSQHKAYIPGSLDDCIIGSRTAAEINWY